jgi:flagellar M-ring protein FliF
MANNEQGMPTAVAVTASGAGAMPAQVNPYLVGIASLPVPRQIGVILGLAASIALGVWLVLWTQQADLRPLYGSLEHLDASAVVGVLESNKINYRIDENSGALLVEGARIHEARLKLAEAGMPGERAAGFELLDEQQGIGTSQFMETARYRRSLEGELSRTIASINSVRGARVHLAMPERSVFLRDQRRASASVLLDVIPGRVVQEGQVRAIGNLVASSVPDLELSQVTIVDQKGKLLSNFSDDAEAVMANKQLEHTTRIEDQLVKRVHRILEPVIGGGRYKAEVTADVDFTAVEQADETYNPDLPAMRSEQRVDEQRVAGDAGAGIPGALSNQPPAAGEAPEVATAPAGEGATGGDATRNLRSQSTRNFELDRSLSYTRHQVGKLRRLTVAVVLDDRVRIDPETGERNTLPWDQESLDRITMLVRDTVGYDAARGDSVNVVNAAFVDVERDDLAIEPVPIWQQEWFFPVLRQSVGLLAVLLVLVAVVRPVLRSLSSNVKQMRAIEERHRMERVMAETAAAEAAATKEDSLMLPPPQHDYERGIVAIQALLDSDAERVAQVVRKWVREGD